MLVIIMNLIVRKGNSYLIFFLSNFVFKKPLLWICKHCIWGFGSWGAASWADFLMWFCWQFVMVFIHLHGQKNSERWTDRERQSGTVKKGKLLMHFLITKHTRGMQTTQKCQTGLPCNLSSHSHTLLVRCKMRTAMIMTAINTLVLEKQYLLGRCSQILYGCLGQMISVERECQRACFSMSCCFHKVHKESPL